MLETPRDFENSKTGPVQLATKIVAVQLDQIEGIEEDVPLPLADQAAEDDRPVAASYRTNTMNSFKGGTVHNSFGRSGQLQGTDVSPLRSRSPCATKQVLQIVDMSAEGL